jgi:hypothetical protein
MESNTFNKKITVFVFCQISGIPCNGAGSSPIITDAGSKTEGVKGTWKYEISYIDFYRKFDNLNPPPS